MYYRALAVIEAVIEVIKQMNVYFNVSRHSPQKSFLDIAVMLSRLLKLKESIATGIRICSSIFFPL
jgi:hypothetical protein